MGESLKSPIPWWTWIAPIAIQTLARFAGPFVFISPGFYLVYLPYLLASLFILWWGPRVLIGVFISSALGAFFTGKMGLQAIPFLAGAEVLKAYLSWLVWKYFKIHQRDLRSTTQLFYCWVFVFMIPNFLGSYVLMAVLTLGGIFSETVFLKQYWQLTLADTFMLLLTTFPAFLMLSNYMFHKGWTVWRKSPFE